MIDNDLEPMRLAIAASRSAMLAGNMPFGAALVRDAHDVRRGGVVLLEFE